MDLGMDARELKEQLGIIGDVEALEDVSRAFYEAGFLIDEQGAITGNTSALSSSFNEGASKQVVCFLDFEDDYNRRVASIFAVVSNVIHEADNGIECDPPEVGNKKISVTLHRCDL